FAQILAQSEVPLASLEAARRRNPRFGETRLLLLDLYGRNGRPDDAIREAQSLVTLMPQQRTLVVRLIAGLAGREGGEAALVRALPTSNVRGAVMLRLAQTGAERSLLENLATPMRGLAEDPAQRGWIGSLVTAIASRPDPMGARSLWAIFHDVDAAHIGTTLVDPEFEDGEGDPPFSWSLPGSRAGIAEFQDGALNVFYYGRASATFAQQILTLPPGSYSITSRVTSSEQEMPQGLSWRVICLEGGQSLVHIQLSAFIASASREGEKFAVPSSGCTVQNLQLVATPADITHRQSARIENVLIEQAAR
ncbi:MAG TPA: hypothetical protein VEZ26_01210, partial [Sphingomonadaceae bacterium]|nr:hypothetical protein [Sphingomonadaceae bacterium]